MEHCLGELRPFIGRVGFFAEDRDGALKAARAQRFRCAAAGLARSSNYDIFDWRRQLLLSLPDEAFDAPLLSQVG